MPCRDCLHYLPSEKALAPRSGLANYGYCQAAPSVETRSRLFSAAQAPCWLNPSRYKKEFAQ